MKSVFVLLINYNKEEMTTKCLEGLLKVKKDKFSLNTLVIDNNPENPISIDENKFVGINLKVIYNKENRGFAGGMNTGIKYAIEKKADFIVVMNNDIEVDDSFLEELLKTFEKSDCGIVSPKIYFAKGHEFHKDKYKKEDLGNVIWYAGGTMDFKNVIASHRGVDEVDHGQFDELSETDFTTGCCMMVKKEVIEKIGFFDERYFLYYEDNDLSQRAKKAGFKIYYQPRSKLHHINAGSTGGSGSSLQDYFITRNRLLFGSKFAAKRARIALFKESLYILAKGRKWQTSGVRDFYLKRFGKGSYIV